MKKKIVTDVDGMAAAARVIAAGGRVPKKFAKARPVSAGPTLGALEAQAKVSAARAAAFEVLRLVGAGKGHSDDLLGRLDDLSEQDRNLATALVMGVLRWQIALDAMLKKHLQRPEQRLAEGVSIVLRIGAFQLLHMDRIPAHAALSESVELCRAAGEPHAAGMVNAVLRKVAAGAKMAAEPAPIFERVAVMAERLGHPAWMVERWVKAYGREAAVAVCEADQREPEGGALFEADPILPGIDDGSRLVAELAVRALPAVEGRKPKVWDCCAAPGGKTLVMAARLPDADLLATDVSVRRLAVTEARLKRNAFGKKVRAMVADAAELPAAEGAFDLILCDVPCSGTGTLARNPEIRLKLEVGELGRQAKRQEAILRAALKRLAPGGRLVYSTCSLEPEECEAVVAAVAGGFRMMPIEELLPETKVAVGSLVRDNALRTLPGVVGCDGFYAVVLERPKN